MRVTLRTNLIASCSFGQGATVKRFIDSQRANIDAQDDRGWTPLHHAASQNLMQTVRWLIERGADRSIATNDGHLPVNLVRRNPYTGSRRGHIPRRIDARVEEMKSILQLDQHGERVAA
ncbi:MAG: ankyrin repeat domain-containing protein [Ignavibacteria bacterium]|nr:ankyrin repeat domain-containing protein [Ignavibacteria bacterium]